MILLTLEHIPHLESLLKRCGERVLDGGLQAMLSDPSTCLIGQVGGDRLIGYATLAELPFDAELQAIGVDPDWRGRGIGTALLNTCIETATAWQSERLLLEVRVSNQPALALYRRAGFASDGVRVGYYPPHDGSTRRVDAILMSRPLVAE